MEIIVLEKRNRSYAPFEISCLDAYRLHDNIQVDDDTYISDFIDINYDPKQTSHHYTPGPPASPISVHWYSVIITQDDSLLYFITSENPNFGNMKSMLRRQTINEIIN